MGNMGGALEEARQRGEALRRALNSESLVRTREDGGSANHTEMTGCAIAEKDKVRRLEAESKERSDIALAAKGCSSLKSNFYCAVDETCFPCTESSMRKFPL